MKLMDIHSLVTLIGAIVIAVFSFLYPDKTDSLPWIAGAFFGLNTGQAIGYLGKGGQRALQGGSTAPDKIISPIPNGP